LAGGTSKGDDVERVRAWFARLAEHVRAVDFAGARAIFAEDLIAFGTYSDFVTGREAVEATQWRKVWPFISDFRWRLGEAKALVAADRLSAVGMAVFDSTGYREDGSPYDRPGRATVAFRRPRIAADWVAQHTHMSLFRGVPDRSFGAKR
jgi:ketosteroid isomerase-like protein